MIEGKMIVGLDQKQIIDILPEGEIDDCSHGVLALNQWAIPHWDWLICVRMGAVQINVNTAACIIDRLKEVIPGQDQATVMLWLNYGWSINVNLPDWKCQIDFSKIYYKGE